MQETIITDEGALIEYVDGLRARGIGKVALDMEGDQGMFHYKYAVSILQCFDGDRAVVIDTLQMGSNDTLRDFLTCQDIIKVMFSCGNDVFMAQNALGCTIAPINDISIAQKLLGMPINLANYLNIDKGVKDSFQRANWLLRPIRADLLTYAINDVLMLLDIEDDLSAQLVEQGLYDEYIASSRAASEKKHIVDPHLLFATKFPGYVRMPYEKKRLAAAVWIFRELLGEKFDCPVGYMLPKRLLVAALDGWAGGKAGVAASVEREINRGRKQSKKLSAELINDLLDRAMRSPHIPPEAEGRKPKAEGRKPKAEGRRLTKSKSFKAYGDGALPRNAPIDNPPTLQSPPP